MSFDHQQDDTGGFFKCLGALLVPGIMVLAIFLVSQCRGDVLAWDTSPSGEAVTGYRVYRYGVLVGETKAPRFDLAASGSYHVTAVNAAGESVPSEPLAVTAKTPPAIPAPSVTYTLQLTNDLGQWFDAAKVTITHPTERQFHRIKIERTP